jgi:predicted phosphodiesterase
MVVGSDPAYAASGRFARSSPQTPPMDSTLTATLSLAMLLALCVESGAQENPAVAGAHRAPSERVRIFFIADAHSNHDQLARFIEEANRDRPDLVLDGGDTVHDGTEAEFRRAVADRARLHSPWYAVRGNHDAELRGRFSAPPPHFPALETTTFGDLRIVLLDNHEEVLTDEQFERLEAELEARSGERIVVVMHVPAILSREPVLMRLRHLLPYRLASPVMRDRDQVERFTELMERHQVVAVLSGHTHFPDHTVRGGVHYIVTGALGGLTPGLGIPPQYTEIIIENRDVRFRRIALGRAAGNPVSFVARAFRFYVDLNGFNHAEQGWSYVPSASVQLRSAIQRTETAAGDAIALWSAASFERVLGRPGRQAAFADIALSVGSQELASHLAMGFKLRPIGDFNRNLFVAGAATGNAGILAATATAGVGTQVGFGFEWQTLTGELSRSWSTNHRSIRLTLGHRF